MIIKGMLKKIEKSKKKLVETEDGFDKQERSSNKTT
jgi:hypothetical protein